MTTKPIITGFAWHVHHDSLLEWCTDYQERLDYIRTTKPKEEQKIRVERFRMVKGVLPQPLLEAREAYDQARVAYDLAWATNDLVRAALNKARAAYDVQWVIDDKVWEAYDQACAVYDLARAVYDLVWHARNKAEIALSEAWAAYNADIQALHRVECPDCPWDGHTLFPKPKQKQVKNDRLRFLPSLPWSRDAGI